jgi:hypothetical protein
VSLLSFLNFEGWTVMWKWFFCADLKDLPKRSCFDQHTMYDCILWSLLYSLGLCKTSILKFAHSWHVYFVLHVQIDLSNFSRFTSTPSLCHKTSLKCTKHSGFLHRTIFEFAESDWLTKGRLLWPSKTKLTKYLFFFTSFSDNSYNNKSKITQQIKE